MLRMLEAQAPAKQTATDTISTLSSRLNNGTLLEDRRAAILGLRSFAKEYPASVASGSLRGLIGCLNKDLDDVDTTKVVLETLIMLFNPNPGSPEAGEEIALWLADEFTQRQDNIQILLNILESTEFYMRLYSLQLITAIFTSRPERTQECVLSAALGTSRLVSTLDDLRDAIRNAGLLLLADLTQSSTELQKLVAFEGTFDRIFQLIQQEGGLKQGGIIIQDCLDLLASLVRQNTSNQSLFRESACVTKLAHILKSLHDQPIGEDVANDYPNPQMLKNLWGLLAVIRLFLVSGSVGTNINQKTFQKHGLLDEIIDLAFRPTTDPAIRTEALYTCADMIRGNAELQAGFAQLQVPVLERSAHQTESNGAINGGNTVHIIDALLDLVIAAPPSISFNHRLAACECIKAYFINHTQIRLHFLERAIEGHTSGEDETANILTTLLRDGAVQGTDPYRIWFAAVLLLHLIWNDSEAKSTVMRVSEGDAESGEEVVTCIQSIAGNLMANIERDDDERIVIAYFMLLSCWLFEDSTAVDDFLGEASFVQVLMRQVSTSHAANDIPKGLSALLLGILYHYSTKDSPISRRKFQPLLLSGMGREKYLQSLSQLRQHPMIRDYEVFSQGHAASNQSHELAPYSYFDSTFVEFLKDNFSKFSRAIDRDPGIEVHVSEEQGIDRDLVDSLRSDLDGKAKGLQAAELQILDLERQLDLSQANHRKETETHSAEFQRIQHVNTTLQKNHEAEVQQLTNNHSTQLQDMQADLNRQITDLKTQLALFKKTSTEETERTKEYYERSLSQARNAKAGHETIISTLQKSLEEVTRNHESSRRTIADLQDENSTWKKANETLKSASQKKDARLADLQKSLTKQKEMLEDEKTKVTTLEKEVSELDTAAKSAEERAKVAKNEAKEKEEARSNVQTELDDLLMILGDLEKKRAADKKRLKELGEEVSEDEDDEEEEEDDEDDVD